MSHLQQVQKQLESSLVPEDDDTTHNLEAINCVIRAIYRLSFNHYLKRNGLALSDLDADNQMAHFRRLDAWPSQSKFVFSLRQMRDAYRQLAMNSLARRLMSEHQREQALRQRKPKHEFWSVLGEAPTAAESFHSLEQDINTPREELQRMRLLAHAFRLVLFQNKITQYRETGNFLALLRSANKELAQEAFQHCAQLLPFAPDFFQSGGQEAEEEAEEEGEGDENCKSALKNMIDAVQVAMQDLQTTKRQLQAVADMLQAALNQHEEFCERFAKAITATDIAREEDFFEADSAVHEQVLDLI